MKSCSFQVGDVVAKKSVGPGGFARGQCGPGEYVVEWIDPRGGTLMVHGPSGSDCGDPRRFSLVRRAAQR